MNRLNKTESAIFLIYRFSLFLKDPFFQIIKTLTLSTLFISSKKDNICLWRKKNEHGSCAVCGEDFYSRLHAVTLIRMLK